MEIGAADMLNLKSSLKHQNRIREGRGRTDSSIMPHDVLESGNKVSVIDPIEEIDHGLRGDAEGDYKSPSKKFNENEEDSNGTPLRISSNLPTQCHILGSAPIEGDIVMKKQHSLIRKRGYSDIDQNNFQALELNASASLNKEFDRKIKEFQ